MSPPPHTVLVTAVGGIIGCGIVQSLRISGRVGRILGVDIHPDAVGSHWCDRFERILPAVDERYLDALCEHANRHEVDLVIPGTEEEMLALHDSRNRWPASVPRIALNSPELIESTRDKWKAYETFRTVGIPTPITTVETNFEAAVGKVGLPMLGKRRNSHSGRGMRGIAAEEDFHEFRKAVGKHDFLFQQIVGSEEEEYTVSVFGFGDGTALTGPLLQRRLAKDGSTGQARTVDDAELNSAVDLVTRQLCPLGSTNYQFRRHEGEFLLLEINPRISSATSIRRAFGFNEAALCVEYFLEGRRPRTGPFRQGTAFRYTADEVRYGIEEAL